MIVTMSNSTMTRPDRDKRSPGEVARDAGSGRVIAQEHSTWRGQVADAITALARTGVPFTVDAVRELVAEDPKHPNSWGAAFLIASLDGTIVPAGFVSASRRSRHAAILRVWTGA